MASQIKSKVGSKDNQNHTPGGVDKKNVTHKTDLSNVKSKVGSKDNLNHVPGGGKKVLMTRRQKNRHSRGPL